MGEQALAVDDFAVVSEDDQIVVVTFVHSSCSGLDFDLPFLDQWEALNPVEEVASCPVWDIDSPSEL